MLKKDKIWGFMQVPWERKKYKRPLEKVHSPLRIAQLLGFATADFSLSENFSYVTSGIRGFI